MQEVLMCFFRIFQLGLNCYDFEWEGVELPDCPGVQRFSRLGRRFCYEPRAGELSFRGENGEPFNNFPLQECQGACTTDEHCDVSSFRFNVGLISQPGSLITFPFD